MLKIEVIQFETQDVIVVSCVCSAGIGKICAENNHYGCLADDQPGHKCGLGED